MFNFFYKNVPLRRCLVTTLIVAICFISGGYVLLLPKRAQASGLPTVDIGHIAMQIGKFVWEKIQWVWEKAKTAANYIANQTQAVLSMEERAEHWADLAMQIVIETALRTLLTMLTNDIIDWVRNGYEGKPAFLSSNFGNYLSEAADNAGGEFVTQFLGAGWLCDEIDLAIKIPLLQEHTFDQKVRCTLSDMGRNLQNFANDFSNGGWTEWIALSSPQNNYYGASLMAQEEKERVEYEAEKEAAQETLIGDGFLSINKCTWYDASGQVVEEHNGVRGKTSLPDKCRPENASAAGVARPCNQVCQVQTPASAVSNITNKSLTAGMDRVNATLAALAAKGGNFFKPYIMAIGESMINKLITDGLAELQKQGPSSSNPTQALPAGETLPTPSTIPADTNKEMIPVLTTEQNLEIANKSLQQLRASQFKVIQLVDKLRTVNDDNVNGQYDFMRSKGVDPNPKEYTPVDFFYLLDYFQPVLTGEISWYNQCVPNAHRPKWQKYFDQHVNNNIAYLTTPITTDSGVTRKRVDFERYDSFLEEVSDDTVETRDNNGVLIKKVQTIIKEQTNTYSFSVIDLIDEGMLTTLLTIRTVNTGELVTISTSPKKTQWVDSSGTQTIPTEKAYSWFEWYIDITNDNTGEKLDLYSESTSQEAINHLEGIFTYFVEQFQDSPGETADLITKVDDALDYLGDTYIPAAELYLKLYESNLDNPEIQVVLDAEQDMLVKKVEAIDRIKAIDPTIMVSNTFEDLAEEVREFSELQAAEEGKLSQIIGDKDYPNNKNLYGLIDALGDVYPQLVVLYSLCRTGRYD